MWVLGAGPIPPNPSELLGSTAMRSLLANLASRFDYVVIDTPPILPVTDAVVLSSLVDGVIIVVGSGVVQRDQLVHGLENLESVAARVLGLVLNRVPVNSAGYGGYGYGTYGYSSYTMEIPKDEATRAERKRAEQV